MDNSKKIELTPEGRQKLLEELAYREGEKHDEIVEHIKEARSHGDLSENSEYDDAKDEQAKNESRIVEIRQILATAVVVESGASTRGLQVSIGTTVELEDERGKKTKFTIVGTTETNSLEHKISNESPVGAALIGHKKGDSVEVQSPSGKDRTYLITGITR